MRTQEAADQSPLQRLRRIATAAAAASTTWITPEHIGELQDLAAGLGAVLSGPQCADGELDLLWEAVCDLWVRDRYPRLMHATQAGTMPPEANVVDLIEMSVTVSTWTPRPGPQLIAWRPVSRMEQ